MNVDDPVLVTAVVVVAVQFVLVVGIAARRSVRWVTATVRRIRPGAVLMRSLSRGGSALGLGTLLAVATTRPAGAAPVEGDAVLIADASHDAARAVTIRAAAVDPGSLTDGTADPADPEETSTWVVEPGDHLWSIAARTAPNDVEVGDHWRSIVRAQPRAALRPGSGASRRRDPTPGGVGGGRLAAAHPASTSAGRPRGKKGSVFSVRWSSARRSSRGRDRIDSRLSSRHMRMPWAPHSSPSISTVTTWGCR